MPNLHAGQLSGDARASIPADLQQVIVIDYRAMQNSQPAMELRNRVVPPELKKLEASLRTIGLNPGEDVDQLAFAAFRVNGSDTMTRTVGIASGQFEMRTVLANMRKNKVKPEVLRTNKIYPMGASGMRICFLDPTTFVFGQDNAVRAALDARDGITRSLLSNSDVLNLMPSVQNDAVWSVLDAKGTQTMMKSLLSQGPGASLADYDTIKKRMQGSRYGLDFDNGVHFQLDVISSDRMSATTMSAILNAAVLYKKVSGSDSEKAALEATKVNSDANNLQVRYSASDNQFASLLGSNLFTTVVQK